jgi:outer membrane biogenesis lipoprotein LolB
VYSNPPKTKIVDWIPYDSPCVKTYLWLLVFALLFAACGMSSSEQGQKEGTRSPFISPTQQAFNRAMRNQTIGEVDIPSDKDVYAICSMAG